MALQRWTSIRIAALVALTSITYGCASAPPASSVACSRVALEPAPPWTAAATWNAGEDELVLVDPGSRGLAGYGRDGRRLREIPLPADGLDFGEPMRFERLDSGYALVGKRQIVRLDEDFSVRRSQRPFDPLEARGVVDGTLNDVVLHGGVLHGYADYVDLGDEPAEDAAGTWRRGFVRLDPADGELEMLHELPIEHDGGDGEYASYYLYDRRPYVARLGEKVYVLRFTEPWSVHRMTRRGLRQVAAGEAGEERRAHALQAWNGKLYVLASRVAPKAGDETAGERVTPAVALDPRARREIKSAAPAMARERRQWTLHEIDPRGGDGRRLALPTSAERLRLVPGRAFWTAIEETTSPNLGGAYDRTTFLYLPSAELASGSFSCSS